jgi:hypothetical protein
MYDGIGAAEERRIFKLLDEGRFDEMLKALRKLTEETNRGYLSALNEIANRFGI